MLNGLRPKVRLLVGLVAVTWGSLVLFTTGAAGADHECDDRPVRSEEAVEAERDDWARNAARHFAADFRYGQHDAVRYAQLLHLEGLALVDERTADVRDRQT